MRYTIETITLEVKELGPGEGTFFSAPSHTAEPEMGTYDAAVQFTTADGWVGDFAVVRFPKAGLLMGRFVWTGGVIAAPYDRLNTAGNTTVKEEGGKWLVPVKAMRKKGKDYPTLNRVTEEELDSLAGRSFRSLLGEFGAFELERHGDLDPSAGKTIINGLGLRMDAGNNALLGAMIAVTRPLALVRDI